MPGFRTHHGGMKGHERNPPYDIARDHPVGCAKTEVIRLMRISTIEVYDQNYEKQRRPAVCRALLFCVATFC